MFYTVFSTSDNPAMQWQSELLEYSWKRVGQEGTLVRLVATDSPHHLPTHRHAHCVATKLWNVHPKTGDSYPIYNKPASLLEWLFRDKPEGTVLLLDPDCVFTRAIHRRAAPGAAVSQAWVNLKLGKPSKKRPFGLPSDFTFLAEHCARVDLPTTAVMIPTLIHTSDLRKLCARWLELCGVVRQNFRRDDQPAWESDMFAYVAACAEYGIHNEPASLGICTNWRSEDAPDAPIIHYCQPIKTGDGAEIFYKYRYAPWARVDTSQEPGEGYGRELISLVNSYVDATQGVVTPPPRHARPYRRADVMEGRVLDDLLLELPDKGGSLWLNITGKAVWDTCDGSRTIVEVGTEIGRYFTGDADMLTSDISGIVGQLHAAGFLNIH